MKRKRLFFGVLVSFMMVVSLIPLSILAQPPLPDNPYAGHHDDGNYDTPIQTYAFEIVVEHPQYWQGNKIKVTLEKKEDVTLFDEHSVLVRIKTADWWRNWFGLDYALNDPNYPNFQNITLLGNNDEVIDRANHVTYVNSMSIGERLSIFIEPGAPWGPTGFYQDERHTIILGFFLQPEAEDDNPEFVISNMDFFDTLNEWVVLDQIREDGILFVGDSLDIEISSLPKGYDDNDYIVNDEFPGTNSLKTELNYVRVHTVFCDIAYTGCDVAPIFVGQENSYFDFTIESNQDHTVNFGGEIDPALGFGFIGYVVELRSVDGTFVSNNNFVYEFTQDYHVIGLWEDATQGSKMLALEAISDFEEPFPVIVNFNIAYIEGVSLPDLKTYSNLYNTDKEFPVKKEGVGTISFDPGLDLLNNANQLTLLSDSFRLEKDATSKKLRAQVDTSKLNFLSNIGATITFENAMETLGFDDVTSENFLEFVDFEVLDNDILVENLSDYIDFERTSYDPTTDILTLRVHHFTEYIISAVEEEEEEQEQETTFKTVVDIALSSDDFSILVEALQKAELVETLQGLGPFTVFAPTNDAFEALLEELDLTKEELLNSEDLSKVLLYHVISDRILASEITDGLKVATLNDMLELTFTLGSVIINGEATVITTDLEADNGIVHVIDTVLLPPNLGEEEVEQEDPTLIPDTSDTPSLGWLFVTTGLLFVLLSFVFRKKPVVKK